jgi:Uma2 family endonuclease
MANAPTPPAMTADEFLAFEARSATKHEFVRGELFAMSGTTDAHNVVAGNVYGLLRAHQRGGPCRAFIESVKLRVDAANAFFYPDVFVTCDDRDHADPLVKRHPTLIVEVLSESSADDDRGAKFADYRKLASLREYVLIDARARAAEVFRRGDDGKWAFEPADAAGESALESVGLRVAVAALYEDAEIPERAARGG